MRQIQELYQKWQSLQPLSPQDERRLLRKFMLDFNFNSNPKRWRVIALPTTQKGGTINEGGQTNTEEE